MRTKVFIDETVVVPLLTRMRLPRWVLLELAAKIAGERANVGETEPPPVAGFETWRWATRYSREDETLKKLGWVICERDQVSGIRHPELKLKFVACTTDHNTGNSQKSPKNVTEKGPASRRLIGKNSNQLQFDVINDEERDDLWYFCLHFSEKFISIEVSRPDSESGGMITNFSDRIIVARPGEIPGIRRVRVPEDFAPVPKPKVSRKPG